MKHLVEDVETSLSLRLANGSWLLQQILAENQGVQTTAESMNVFYDIIVLYTETTKVDDFTVMTYNVS